jgi:hypothetical protein
VPRDESAGILLGALVEEGLELDLVIDESESELPQPTRRTTAPRATIDPSFLKVIPESLREQDGAAFGRPILRT